MTRWMLACVICLPVIGAAQVPLSPQSLFEAGRYQAIVDQLQATSAPPDLYLGAQAHEKLNQPAEAAALYARLAARVADDPWHHVGRSASALASGDLDQALAAGQEAVAAGSNLPEAHYQLGLVQGFRNDYAAAADAFDRSAELSPSLAYAQYHAGLSYYQVKRLDRMAERFGAFLKLAPQAPERARVESIMRTVRGR